MNRRQGLSELLLFLAAAAAGVYGLGRALQGDLPWLGVTAISLIVLAKQMGRVQDQWPSRPKSERRAATAATKQEQEQDE